MRNDASHILAVLIAAAGVACTGRTDRVDNERRAQSGQQRGVHQSIRLAGCVQAGPIGGQYVLQNVKVPTPAEQPMENETMEHPVVQNGSWVRLTGTDDLQNYVGKAISVTGNVADTGENTLGTSGSSGSNKENFERSSRDADTNPARNMPPTTAAPSSSVGNGTAPLIAVERIEKVADSCSK